MQNWHIFMWHFHGRKNRKVGNWTSPVGLPVSMWVWSSMMVYAIDTHVYDSNGDLLSEGGIKTQTRHSKILPKKEKYTSISHSSSWNPMTRTLTAGLSTITSRLYGQNAPQIKMSNCNPVETLGQGSSLQMKNHAALGAKDIQATHWSLTYQQCLCVRHNYITNSFPSERRTQASDWNTMERA